MDGQVACYNECFRMAEDDTDWFIVIVSHGYPSLKASLHLFLCSTPCFIVSSGLTIYTSGGPFGLRVVPAILTY